MNLPELPANASRRDMRIALVRMRLELNRQELRHETLVMLQPLRQARQFGQHWKEHLGHGSTPLWVAGGAVLLTTLAVKKTDWRRWLRLALVAFPLLRRHPPRSPGNTG